MLKFISFLIFALLFLSLGLSHTYSEVLPIIAGEGIGYAELGMSKEDMEYINQMTDQERKCPVKAVFKDNLAMELSTSWGGACSTPEGIMASTTSWYVVVRLLGVPGEKIWDADYEDGAKAYWMRYSNLGIAFRVYLLSDGKGIVQAIKVFSKTAPK